MEKGLLMIYTGEPHMAAVPAAGQVFRALGRKMKVCVIRFPGGTWDKSLLVPEPWSRLFEVRSFGSTDALAGWGGGDPAAAAAAGWEDAAAALRSGEFGIIVLDGLGQTVERGLLSSKTVLESLQSRTESLHVIITGGTTLEELLAAADLVTDVILLKGGPT